jgi:peptide/nickel transport system permease protein
MLRYTVRRLLQMLVVIWLISILTFWLFWAGPAMPAKAICGKHCTAQQIADINAARGFDQPVIVQYGRYMSGLVNPHGRELGTGSSAIHCPWPCFDRSLRDGLPVWGTITDAFWPTLWLALGGAALWLLGGPLFGAIAATHRGRWADKLIVTFALAGAAFPTMVLGYLLTMVFINTLHALPYADPFNTQLLTVGPLPWLKEYALPWLTLGLINIALYTRLTRATMLDAMNQDFIQTARAKGLSEHRVVYRHGLRVTLPPIITIFGLDLGGLLGGAVIVEKIFNIPGLGQLTIKATLGNDLTIIMAVTMLSAFFIVFINLLVDLTYAFLDPRVRLSDL